MENPSSAICEAKHGNKCDVWEEKLLFYYSFYLQFFLCRSQSVEGLSQGPDVKEPKLQIRNNFYLFSEQSSEVRKRNQCDQVFWLKKSQNFS